MMLSIKLELGPYIIYPGTVVGRGDGKLWITNLETDEGMECSEENLQRVLTAAVEKFWDDNF